MEISHLGSTKYNVSRIGMGCEPLGGTDWGNVDEKKMSAAICKAVELGINIFDTADIYGLGKSEERLSKALDKHRNDVVIVTKGGVGWEVQKIGVRAKTFIDASSKHLIKSIEGSLKRLRIECIPIYLIHWPDPKCPIEDSLEALIKQKEKGKIENIGLSNCSAKQLKKAVSITNIAAVEIKYNLLDRNAENEIIQLCHKEGIGFLAYGVLAQGLLTGKYGPDSEFDKNDRRHRLDIFRKKEIEKIKKKIDLIREIGNNHGKEISQTVIRWVLENDKVTCAIIGAKTTDQVKMNLEAMEWNLRPDEKKIIDQCFKRK